MLGSSFTTCKLESSQDIGFSIAFRKIEKIVLFLIKDDFYFFLRLCVCFCGAQASQLNVLFWFTFLKKFSIWVIHEPNFVIIFEFYCIT